MIDRARRRDHHIGRAIVAREVGAQPARIDRAHRLGRPEDRAPDRLVRERDALQVFEDEIVGRVLHGADFLHDHVLLAREFLRLEGRIGEDVRQHVEGERHVGAQDARVIGRALDAGRRIEIAADRFDLFGDLARGALLRALEGHVLEEMRDAVLVWAFVPAARADPNAERSALQVRHRVCDHGETRGQTRDVRTHAAAPSRAARLAAMMNFSTAP